MVLYHIVSTRIPIRLYRIVLIISYSIISHRNQIESDRMRARTFSFIQNLSYLRKLGIFLVFYLITILCIQKKKHFPFIIFYNAAPECKLNVTRGYLWITCCNWSFRWSSRLNPVVCSCHYGLYCFTAAMRHLSKRGSENTLTPSSELVRNTNTHLTDLMQRWNTTIYLWEHLSCQKPHLQP